MLDLINMKNVLFTGLLVLVQCFTVPQMYEIEYSQNISMHMVNSGQIIVFKLKNNGIALLEYRKYESGKFVDSIKKEYVLNNEEKRIIDSLMEKIKISKLKDKYEAVNGPTANYSEFTSIIISKRKIKKEIFIELGSDYPIEISEIIKQINSITNKV
jgi:hypothetical protein